MSERVPERWQKRVLGDFLTTLPKSKLPSGASHPGGIYNFYVCSSGILRSFHCDITEPSVLFSTGGEAAVHYATGNYSYSTDVWATSFKEPLCNEFVFRHLDHNIIKLNYAGFQGSAIKHLDKEFIKKLEIPYPSLPEQKKIVSVLTSVDEVIEGTKKQIDKLQDLKKATMNELLTKGIGHTEFKDSELGRMPENWEVKTLSEVSLINRGRFSHRPRNAPDFYGGRYPYLQTGDIPTQSTDIVNFTQTLNDRGFGVSKLFPIGTLVLTIAATIGEVGILTFNSCFPDSLVGITVKGEVVKPHFLLYTLRHQKEELIREAPESAQKNLNLDVLNSFLVRVPPIEEQGKIESVLLAMDKNILSKDRKLLQTQYLKKSLMQDLLTGDVRVKAC